MAKLVLSMNNIVQGEYEINQEKLTIGRKPDNDIQIDNLSVSGKHALIITMLDDSFLEDLGSTNGSFVNGKLIKKYALKDGDVISVGKHELKYINEHATADDEFEKTMIIKFGATNAVEASVQAAEKAVSSTTRATAAVYSGDGSMPLGRLTVLNGPIAGKEFELKKALITLGKPGTQVAVIARRPRGYFLTHVESDGDGKRYPIVNGEAIGAKAYQLKGSDLIELAGIKMAFSILS